MLEECYGLFYVKLFWDLVEDLKVLVRCLIVEYGIVCDFVLGILYVDYCLFYVEESCDYVEYLCFVYGYEKICFVDGEEIGEFVGSLCYYGGILDLGVGYLYLFNFVFGLVWVVDMVGVIICERICVVLIDWSCVDMVVVEMESGIVIVRYLILVCNGYLGWFVLEVVVYVMLINNYIVVIERLFDEIVWSVLWDNIVVVDSKFVINYFCFLVDKWLLFGGGESYGYWFFDDIKVFV